MGDAGRALGAATLEAAPLRPATASLETYRDFWETRLDLLEAKIRTRRGR